MAIHPREKREFYHGLAQLTESGAAFPKALQTLRTGASKGVQALIDRLRAAIERNAAIPDAFTEAQPLATELECSVMSAGARAGRLVPCARYLSEYFDSLAKLRATLWKKSAYSIFIFHFGVLLLGLPAGIVGGHWGRYLVSVGSTLLCAWGVAGGIWLFAKGLQSRAADSVLVDGAIAAFPLIGKLRRSLVASRFCATFEMQLEAGVNVLEALSIAGRASQSALYRVAIKRMNPALLSGQKPGELMETASVFPREMVRSIRLGEETGQLSFELDRLAAEYREKALGSIAVIGEWVPRVLYIVVLLYSAWQILSVYQGVSQDLQRVIDQ